MDFQESYAASTCENVLIRVGLVLTRVGVRVEKT